MLPPLSRRRLLAECGMGMGSLALAGLLADSRAAESLPALGAGSVSPVSSLAPKSPHFAPRATRVIHLFMNGGPSQIDLFDPKPALRKYAGKLLGKDLAGDRRIGGVGMPSPFRFDRYGQSGM